MLADTKVSDGGSVSITFGLTTEDGPRLVPAIVYWNVSPGAIVGEPTTLLTT